MRPNIRVEIQNNLVEAMEVDENEEGEISDRDEMETSEKQNVEIQPKESNKPSIFDKKEEERLQERARRFCLNPEEIKNFKDDDLQILHSSLGINASNESNVRFEVIHMRGIDQMTTGDILDYLLEYAPVSIEWIDTESCNVVWTETISSARALHFMSKAVRGMPARDDTSYFDNLQESEEVDKSILMINKDREVELKEDDESPKLLNEQNSIDISEITGSIPPGYWRLGNKHPKSASLLMRFALKTDKKPLQIEQFSRYYKNQGKKKVAPQTEKAITHGIFGRNKDMHKVNDGNPWTVLAKNWDEDAPFREPERVTEPEAPKVDIKNNSLRNRLGLKRKEEPTEEVDEEEKVEEEVAPKKKIKIPRMRMYADEEEEKIKRRQMLQRINHQIKKIDQDKSTNSDLRSILNMTSRTHGVKLEKAEPEVFDLGSRLKNRNKKMVFQIKTEAERGDRVERVERVERVREDRHVPKPRERHRDRIRRKYSHSDDEDAYRRHDKPKSKVAVVIKTQKRPTVASAVASTVWSRVAGKADESASESKSESSSASEASEDSDSEEVEVVVPRRRITDRPGFTGRSPDRGLTHSAYKNPLKIEINNDHCRRS